MSTLTTRPDPSGHHPFIVSWVTVSDLSLDLAQRRGPAAAGVHRGDRCLGVAAHRNHLLGCQPAVGCVIAPFDTARDKA